jgi:hypothetical protein
MIQHLQPSTVYLIFALACLAVIGAELLIYACIRGVTEYRLPTPKPDAVKLLPKTAKEALRARTRWERDWAEIENDISK